LLKIKAPKTSRGLAVLCARTADEKISKDIVIMNLKKIENPPADYFIISTCDSEAQMRAIVDSLILKCKELGLQRPRIEGFEVCQWVLIDFFDVVMHLMLPNVRQFYNLERLWGDAQFLQLNDEGKARVIKNLDMKWN